MSESQQFHVRLPPDQYEWLRTAAYLSRKSMNKVVMRLINAAMTEEKVTEKENAAA
jgi:predicted HicB family RNase H-like nuclease